MASGNALFAFTAAHSDPPAANYATQGTRNNQIVLEFDPGTVAESAVFRGWLPPHYSGGGITLVLRWCATTATSGAVKWHAQFERVDAGTLDIDADSFATAQTTTTTTSGTSGVTVTTTITFTNSQIDGLVAGEWFRLKVTRDANDAADTMTTSDAQLYGVSATET